MGDLKQVKISWLKRKPKAVARRTDRVPFSVVREATIATEIEEMKNITANLMDKKL